MSQQPAHHAEQPIGSATATQSGPESWVDLHGDYLYRYALFRLRDESAAEETVQETLFAALKSYDRFSGHSSERTWLVSILKHKITDHYRKLSRQSSFDSLDDLPLEPDLLQNTGEWAEHFDPIRGPVEWNDTPAQALEKAEFRQALVRCLNTLPERMASVFALREMEELSSEEICKVLNISATNLWVMLHRARAQLRLCIENKWFRKAH